MLGKSEGYKTRSAFELPQKEKTPVVISKSARSKIPKCREQAICHISRRIDRHNSRATRYDFPQMAVEGGDGEGLKEFLDCETFPGILNHTARSSVVS